MKNQPRDTIAPGSHDQNCVCVVPPQYNDLFCTRVAWVCMVCLLLCKERRLFSIVFAITERRDMSLYEVPLSVSLLFNNTVGKEVQPNGSPRANHHEQSFRHNKHTHTNQKAATYQHSRHNH